MPGSEILGAKPGVLCDPGEGSRADFFAVVKAECEVGPTLALQLSMGSNLLLERPTEPQQGRIDSFGPGRAPNAHAAKRTFSGWGTSSPLSIMSANT
jgi:hypothetical protein